MKIHNGDSSLILIMKIIIHIIKSYIYKKIILLNTGKKTPPCILEDEIYYDDLVRTYSSEIIPPDYQLIERATPPNSTIIKNDFVKHPMFAISSLFYYCAELFWK